MALEEGEAEQLSESCTRLYSERGGGMRGDRSAQAVGSWLGSPCLSAEPTKTGKTKETHPLCRSGLCKGISGDQ